jgi:hypothetical protein
MEGSVQAAGVRESWALWRNARNSPKPDHRVST